MEYNIIIIKILVYPSETLLLISMKRAILKNLRKKSQNVDILYTINTTG